MKNGENTYGSDSYVCHLVMLYDKFQMFYTINIKLKLDFYIEKNKYTLDIYLENNRSLILASTQALLCSPNHDFCATFVIYVTF